MSALTCPNCQGTFFECCGCHYDVTQQLNTQLAQEQAQSERLKSKRDELEAANHRFANEQIDLKRQLAQERAKVKAAETERDACHKCWDDFTAKVCTVLPELKNAPLFQQAESIVFAVTNRDMLASSILDMQTERDEAKVKNTELESQLLQAREAKHLLRQLFYARCITGTKICDELEMWGLLDYEKRFYDCLNEESPPPPVVRVELLEALVKNERDFGPDTGIVFHLEQLIANAKQP